MTRNAHAEITTRFQAAWEAARGAEYQPTAADRSQLGRLLRETPRERLAEIPVAFAAYLDDPDPFLEKHGWSLSYFCTSGGLNKYRAKARPPAAPRLAPALQRDKDTMDIIAAGVAMTNGGRRG